jgi:hypothetical protein
MTTADVGSNAAALGRSVADKVKDAAGHAGSDTSKVMDQASKAADTAVAKSQAAGASLVQVCVTCWQGARGGRAPQRMRATGCCTLSKTLCPCYLTCC